MVYLQKNRLHLNYSFNLKLLERVIISLITQSFHFCCFVPFQASLIDQIHLKN